MEKPSNTDWPFFAYGLFRPGQLGFFQIRDSVDVVTEPVCIAGSLVLRDGLPLLDLHGRGSIKGAVLTFLPGHGERAYGRIAALEPSRQYRWHTTPVGGLQANVLVGLKPGSGGVPCEEEEWNGWNDPLFREALEVIEETRGQHDQDWVKSLFRLQAAYLLLWSSIEHYTSLRYHFGGKARAKVLKIAGELAFAESLHRHVHSERVVHRADDPVLMETLDRNDPKKALLYYYQVRCNITHRGKGVRQDHDMLTRSLGELLAIFRDVLTAAEQDAQYRTG
jgi:hypothetical protein